MSDKIKTVESEITMPMMSLPLKSTIVSVGESVILISPLPKLKNFKDQVESLGTPTDIVAPSGFHHLGIKEASEMYPNARLWGVPILKTKRSDVNWHDILPDGWPFNDELEVILLSGMPKIDEVVFYHKSSKTLIVSDLFFNHIHGKGIGYWLIFNLFGTYKKFAVSKFFAKFITDKKEFKSAAQKILSLDIEKIIVPHGVNVTENAKDHLKKAFEERNLI